MPVMFSGNRAEKPTYGTHIRTAQAPPHRSLGIGPDTVPVAQGGRAAVSVTQGIPSGVLALRQTRYHLPRIRGLYIDHGCPSVSDLQKDRGVDSRKARYMEDRNVMVRCVFFCEGEPLSVGFCTHPHSIQHGSYGFAYLDNSLISW